MRPICIKQEPSRRKLSKIFYHRMQELSVPRWIRDDPIRITSPKLRVVLRDDTRRLRLKIILPRTVKPIALKVAHESAIASARLYECIAARYMGQEGHDALKRSWVEVARNAPEVTPLSHVVLPEFCRPNLRFPALSSCGSCADLLWWRWSPVSFRVLPRFASAPNEGERQELFLCVLEAFFASCD